MRGRSRAAAVAAALVAGLVSLGLAAASAGPQQRSIRDGVFTADQVAKGSEVFEKICVECHPTDNFNPDFMRGWEGATVAELFEQVQGTMPYESPGTLTPEEYANVLVYLFSLNGMAPGERQLPTAVDELREISINGPFEWRGKH